jgi:hypothetical protein
MQVKQMLLAAGVLSTVVAIAPQAAQASPFSGFTFDTVYSQGVTPFDPTRDIKLDSVLFGSHSISNFELVTQATIHSGSSAVNGPGSTDIGDNTVIDAYLPQGNVAENPTNGDIVAALGNLNLNSIIDTEDNGNTVIDVIFDPNKLLNTFFFFERGNRGTNNGGNSDLEVRGIAHDNSYVSLIKIGRNDWKNAGYSINTTEIDGAQRVGSYGIKSTVGLKGLRLISQGGFNGPDYKVFATKVPEPMSLLGLGAVGLMAAGLRRRKLAAAK